MYTHIHTPSLHQLGLGPVITPSNLEGEFFRARHDRYLPICLPASTSNKSREQETRQHRQVVGRSAAPPFDVSESAHQCVELASSWHGGSPPPHPEQRTADCLAVGGERGCCFSEVRGRLFSGKADFSFFLIGPRLRHLTSPRRPTH